MVYPMKMYADPKNDIAFKKLFGDKAHEAILLDFLNDILEKPVICTIEKVSIKDPNNLPIVPGLKATIVDIRCTDDQNKHYQIEMQVAPQSDYAQQCQFYTSYFITKQLETKKPYGVLEPIIFISIVNFNMFDFDHFLSHHRIMDTKTCTQTLNLVEYHFLELSKFTKKEDELITPVDRWAYFFKYAGTFDHVPATMNEDKVLMQALEILKRAAWTQEDMDLYRITIDAELSCKQLSTKVESFMVNHFKRLPHSDNLLCPLQYR